MKSHQHLLLLLIAILLSVVAFTVAQDYQHILMLSTRIDSIGHMVGFFLLAWFLNGVLKFEFISLIACLIFYSAATELGQLYLGFRNGEISDFVADLIGIALFSLIKWSLMMYRKRQTK